MARKIIFTMFSIFSFLVFIEVIFRVILFSNVLTIKELQRPELYANQYDDDDYWKLCYRFGGKNRPSDSKRIHPLLGWSQTYIDKDNPLGLEQDILSKLNSDDSKHKILIYGDSFVRGVADHDFQIPAYMNKHLKNTLTVDLSVGGYGIDQMLLMFKLTQLMAKNPYIIFGILTEDLNRALLSVRTGQKLYYSINNNRLILKGMPIDTDYEHFFERNPPKIKSYIFRLVAHAFKMRFRFHDEQSDKLAETTSINSMLIDEIKRIAIKRNYDLLVILFYPEGELHFIGWKENFLKNKLSETGIPFIDTKPILIEYSIKNKIPTTDFYVKEDGHHNNLGNKVIGDAILNYFLQNTTLR